MLKAITYILENDVTVQSLVGDNSSNTKHKIYPVVVPESEKAPYCVCRVSGRETISKNCASVWNIEVTSFHTSYDNLTLLNNAVIQAIESQTSDTINGEEFAFAYMVNEIDSYNSDHGLYAKSTTFQVNGL